MGLQPVETHFRITVSEDKIAVHFWPTGSLYTFARFTSARDIAEFGPVSPDPVIQHASRSNRTGNYDGPEVLAMAFRLATTAARAGK
jgi:hypothetical protein